MNIPDKGIWAKKLEKQILCHGHFTDTASRQAKAIKWLMQKA